MTGGPAILYVDQTHLGRTVTGLERITLELFSAEALAPLDPVAIPGGSVRRMILRQQLAMPARLLADRRALLLCPGFPPSIPAVLAGGRRVVPYVHDCFLLDRPQDLNWRARHYMAPAFRFALKHCPWLLVNSETTATDVRRHARPDVEITLYRPQVRDVFGVAPRLRTAVAGRSVAAGGQVDLLALGTVEPRKNYMAAARIVRSLRERHGFDAMLHVVGRQGWGGEGDELARQPGVILHGYLGAEEVRALLAGAHLFLTTSHDEGLGLPLLEAQYAGLQVFAPDKPVFREVLGSSGEFVDPGDPDGAAAAIAGWLSRPDGFLAAADMAVSNLARWNRLAAEDRARVLARLAAMSGRPDPAFSAAVPPRRP